MKKLRKIIFWLHLTAGVAAGAVILIMSLTGALLAFEPQVLRLAERRMQTVAPPPDGAPRLGVQTLFAKARETKPELKPNGITLLADPNAAATLTLGREGVLYVNPYTGEVLGGGAKKTRAFFRFVEDMHRWLGVSGEQRAVGRTITGACNTAFLFLAITGVYLWFPKKWTWTNVKSVLFFKRGLKSRARDFNWHNATGFWTSTVLILLTATGMVMSYQWANNLLYALAGSPPPTQQGMANPAASDAPRPGQSPRGDSNERGARNNGGVNQSGEPRGNQRGARAPEEPAVLIPSNLDQLWSRAEQQTANWQAITLRLPMRPEAPLTFSIREGRSWLAAASSQLTLNPTTAEVIAWEPFEASSPGRRARTWVRFLHTGEAGGLPGQVIACLASLGGCLLVWTGLSLAWRRFRAWRAKQAKRLEAIYTSSTAP